MDEVADIFEQQLKDCCFWIEKLNKYKRVVVEAGMIRLLAKEEVTREVYLLEAFENFHKGDTARLDQYLAESGYTYESLEVRALASSTSLLESLESLTEGSIRISVTSRRLWRIYTSLLS